MGRPDNWLKILAADIERLTGKQHLKVAGSTHLEQIRVHHFGAFRASVYSVNTPKVHHFGAFFTHFSENRGKSADFVTKEITSPNKTNIRSEFSETFR